MEMDYGEVLIMIYIMDNGKIIKQMDMEFIYGELGINIKDNGKMV